MSFGYSLSDVVKGVEIAIRIKQIWFEKANRPHALYREFGEDVSHLAGRLAKLDGAYQEGCDLSLRGLLPFNPRDKSIDRDRRALVGNFVATLEDCETLLKENSAMARQNMAVLKAPYWHIAVMPKVTALRDRIKFHMIKMDFIMQSLRDDRLQEISERVELGNALSADLWARQIHGTPAEQLVTPPIPPPLYSKFAIALETNKPSSWSGHSDRKAELLFDSLHRWFLSSTVTYHGPSFGIQTIQQYLNLIKAQFLLEQIQQEHGLPHRYYLAHAVRVLEVKIRQEFRRKDIEKYPIEALDKLGPEQFQIWDATEHLSPSKRPGYDDVGVPLDEILLVHLVPDSGNNPQDLAVMRQVNQDTEFRLIRRRLATPTSIAENDRDPVNIHHYRFIPWFALPTNANPSTKVEIRNSASSASLFYTFSDATGESQPWRPGDLEKFQHALLGYRVVCNKTSFRWQFHKTKAGENRKPSQNRIQLWLPHRLSPRRRENDGDSITTLPTQSSRSLSMSTVATTVQSCSGLQLEKSQRSNTTGSIILETVSGDQGGVNINPIPSPVLFIFTLLNDRYTFLHFELQPQHHLSYQCECPTKPHTCKTVAIQFRPDGPEGKQSEFSYRTFSVDTEKVAEWDLALFAQPQHPKFTKLKMQKTRYLELGFASSDDRIDFAKQFLKLINKYAKELEEIENLKNARQWASDRPDQVKALEKAAQRPASVSSMAIRGLSKRLSRTQSTAPRLGPITLQSAISLPFPKESSP
ncbi:hypothetical protein GJ744_012285 [Endocarpon pusillum]|uniref:Uncharacterized protein n=1 Tax=Endocarpon pusillum TaxID=364733 RepID=A0A8H7E2T0_9EURO|nr:hypothetical protein GJ744_012285 [Endocarpon pusillum]